MQVRRCEGQAIVGAAKRAQSVDGTFKCVAAELHLQSHITRTLAPHSLRAPPSHPHRTTPRTPPHLFPPSSPLRCTTRAPMAASRPWRWSRGQSRRGQRAPSSTWWSEGMGADGGARIAKVSRSIPADLVASETDLTQCRVPCLPFLALSLVPRLWQDGASAARQRRSLSLSPAHSRVRMSFPYQQELSYTCALSLPVPIQCPAVSLVCPSGPAQSHVQDSTHGIDEG